ncbi:SPOR domain-containing protein [Altererythrobacter litoralis]|uniref:SPOR domain-containing protein n=1 Tax=Altererythrobacter litoralis TaxID=3113904 RepID=A0ABU7GE95_9SPHN|nr:SPOR domain-containing protein [Erythrobacteraceae bacterium 1XM1-14]
MPARNFALPLAIAAMTMSASLAGPLSAQQTAGGATSREVVQSLPTPEVERLRAALQRLATEAESVDALIDAGDASLAVGDLEASLGFFGRALELSSENARAKLGLASVYLRSRRPLDALQMFAEAERAGASTADFLDDLGLVQDLVGNNAQAQQSYRTMLATKPGDDETRRRLAISLAISGDRAGFEAALLPLLQRQDLAAHRARAFGLAILGDTKEAAALTGQLMPPDLASRMTPYLDYMPRLTRAQQAAAANLGIFPRAAEIGRDDPNIARVASSADRSAAKADDRLAPRGTPLGERTPARTSPATQQPEASSRLAQVSREQASAQPASVSEAFTELAGPVSASRRPGEGAVDITAIEIPRESREPPKPAPRAHPSRHWVQLATGRDRDALSFDWRRMARKAPDLLGERSPYVVRWGQANRLLAGPFPTQDAAREMVRALRQQGFDSFTYTSPAGEKIIELK